MPVGSISLFMHRFRLIGVFLLIVLIIGAWFASGIQLVIQSQVHAAGTNVMLPDTSSNIHLGLAFNYNVTDPSTETGVVDYVWGSSYAAQPTGIYNTYYAPFDREPGGPGTASSHPLSWFQANHPDWIEYQCDKTTVAYMYGDANVPLDISNPAVLTYLFQTYYAPMIQAGYQGIAFDNVNLDNYSWSPGTGQRCGHYDTAGNWVQQFSGSSTDPAYHLAVLNWAKWMYSQLHSINASVSMNFGYDTTSPADSNSLLENMDLDVDEGGWGNGSNYLTDNAWLTYMQNYQTNVINQGKGLFVINEMAQPFANISQADKQWVIANYLLIKGNHTYLTITGNQEYGTLLTTSEYSAPIGSALNTMYQSQGVYMRDFSQGKVLVNPSSTQSFTITLPSNTYTDVYGNPITSITLGAYTGIVLLGSASI